MAHSIPRKMNSSSLSSLKSCPSELTTFSGKTIPWSSMSRSVLVLFLVVCLNAASGDRRSWEAPGCHLVGNTRTVSIPDCVPFEVTTNACRGFCVSYAIPSPSQTLNLNRNLVITSQAECCGMVETHEVQVWVACRDGYQQKTFKSARSCACSICRRMQ